VAYREDRKQLLRLHVQDHQAILDRYCSNILHSSHSSLKTSHVYRSGYQTHCRSTTAQRCTTGLHGMQPVQHSSLCFERTGFTLSRLPKRTRSGLTSLMMTGPTCCQSRKRAVVNPDGAVAVRTTPTLGRILKVSVYTVCDCVHATRKHATTRAQIAACKPGPDCYAAHLPSSTRSLSLPALL
jgi:hypothetical protein